MAHRKNAIILISFLLLSFNADADENGSLLFHGNCTTCHFDTKTVSAPSVIDIKQKYITAFAKKEDFVEYMSKWVHKPKEETSIMLEAVNKHGLMPELGFDLDALRAISAYIYETDFSKKN
ncbi:MAG: cytochrome C [Sulfurimonas sp.]|nr:cytochrome C [Sulfurimonas sp.]